MDRIQLLQQIKAIGHIVNILIVTALDILDELLSIVPCISKEQIKRKPINKRVYKLVNKFLIN